MKSLSITIHINDEKTIAVKDATPAVAMLCKVVVTFESVEEILW